MPLLRSRHPPEYTARGVANGVFWALTPTLGLQTFEILASWFVARRVFGVDSSLMQAMVWVWVNNPLTMIPMYYLFYVTGLWLTGDPAAGGGYASFLALWDRPDLSWSARAATVVAAVGVPTMIGSLPYAFGIAGLGYWGALRMLRARQRARIWRSGNL